MGSKDRPLRAIESTPLGIPSSGDVRLGVYQGINGYRYIEKEEVRGAWRWKIGKSVI